MDFCNIIAFVYDLIKLYFSWKLPDTNVYSYSYKKTDVFTNKSSFLFT